MAFGLRPLEAWCLRYAADKRDWFISVRAGHPSRLKSVVYSGVHRIPGLIPAVSKPESVKLKTVKEGANPGYVAIPYADRDKAQAYIEQINDAGGRGEGWHFEDRWSDGYEYLVDGAGNFSHADIDLAGVYGRTGDGAWQPVPPEDFLPYLNGLMDKTGLHSPVRLAPGTVMTERPYGVTPLSTFQHGDQDSWDKKNDFSYGGGLNAGLPKGPYVFFQRGECPTYSPNPMYWPNDSDYLDKLIEIGQDHIYTQESKDNARARSDGPRYSRYPWMPAYDFDRL